MFLLYLLVFILAIGLGGMIAMRSLNRDPHGDVTGVQIPGLIGAVSAAIGLLIVGFTLLGSFGQIQAGHRGVVLRFGAVTGDIKPEGLYFVTPFVERVAVMDVQVHADKSKATAASHDLQNVATEVTVNYRLDPAQVATVYRDLRNDYVARVMVPAIQEAVKAATAQFDAERLVIERPRVKDLIEEMLQRRLRQHGLMVDGIAITDFQFSPDFSNAIEAKVTSLQLALKAKNDAEIARNEQLKKFAIAHADSYVVVTGAKAEAEAIRIKVSAINAQGGPEYVRLKAIEKWDGTVPQWVSGAGQMVPFINMGAAPGK